MFKHRPTHIQSHLRLHGLPQNITSKSQHLSGLQSQECLSNLDDNRNRQHRHHLPKSQRSTGLQTEKYLSYLDDDLDSPHTAHLLKTLNTLIHQTFS